MPGQVEEHGPNAARHFIGDVRDATSLIDNEAFESPTTTAHDVCCYCALSSHSSTIVLR
jgi:hypothetical protein